MTMLMEIEPLDKLVSFDSEYLARQQEILDITVNEFLTHQRPLTFRKTAAYKACEVLCYLGKDQQVLYQIEQQTLAYFEKAQNTLFYSKTNSNFEEIWLTHLLNFWKNLQNALKAIEFVAAPLDRNYVLNSECETIRTIVHEQLSRTFQQNPNFFAWALQSFSYFLNGFRTNSINAEETYLLTLSETVSMIKTLKLYEGVFEEKLLEFSRFFFEEEGIRMTSDTIFSVSNYVNHISQRLLTETNNIKSVLLPSTVNSIRNIILNELFCKHKQQILYGELVGVCQMNQGVYHLIISEDAKTLKELNFLHEKTNSTSELRKVWQTAIRAEGFRLLQDNFKDVIVPLETGSKPNQPLLAATSVTEFTDSMQNFLRSIPPVEHFSKSGQHKTLISKLINFKKMLIRLLFEVFDRPDEFEDALKEAWVSFLNPSSDAANAIAFLLAKYTDEFLRMVGVPDGSASLEHKPGGIEIYLDRIISILKFLQAKDVFKAFYERDLGRRLLYGKASSVEYEMLFVKKLRFESGPAYTSRMESMFRELELSKIAFMKFQQDSDSNVTSAGIQLDCKVLASGIWPLPAFATMSQPVLPPAITLLQQTYSAFYEKLQKSRTLQWMPALGKCVVKATYEANGSGISRRHDLVVSQYQGLSLLLFNQKDMWTADEISQTLNINLEELQRYLLALYVDPKRRILNKNPESIRKLLGSDEYTVNKSFTSKLLRVVINQILIKEIKEVDQTEQRVEEDRTSHIDAVIVRLMKSNKEMHHNNLMADVLSSLLFKTNPPTVKSRIETLIDREFISRLPEDPQTYTYLA